MRQEVAEGMDAATPYRALHLLPSAPRDLVVETYWRLVRDLRAQGERDGSWQERIEELNRAYAAVLADEPAPLALLQEVQPRARDGLFHRRQPKPPTTQRSPWDLLHIEPGAPPVVVDLAYRYWRLRLRSERGAGALELELLDQAYEATHRGDGPPPPADVRMDETVLAVGPPARIVPESSVHPPSPSPVEGAFSPPEASEQSAGPAPAPDRPRQTRTLRSYARPLLARAARATWALALWFARLIIRGIHAAARGIIALFAAAWRSARSRLERGRERKPARKPQPLIAPESNDGALNEDDAPALEERLASLSAAGPAFGAQPAAPGGAVRGYLFPRDAGLAPVAITDLKPVTIGGHPRCDLVLPSGNGHERDPVVARVWAQPGRVILHALSEGPRVRINGDSLVWAELEEGDEIEIAGASFAFSLSAPGASGAPA